MTNIFICYISVRLTNLKQYPVGISKIIAMINLYGRLKLVWEWLDKDILYPVNTCSTLLKQGVKYVQS